MTTASSAVAVVGGSSQVARFLVPRLVADGRQVTVLSRTPPPWAFSAQVRCVPLDAVPEALRSAGSPATVFWLPPILLLSPWLDALCDVGMSRLVAFGTTAMFYKAESPSPEDQDFARRTAEAEAGLESLGTRRSLSWTVLRPTMTYGCGRDDNVANIAGFVRRFRCFPIAGQAAGRRQPVHADDLAAACMAVVDNPRTSGRAYNVSGGETLSYRDVVSRVFRALGRSPVLLPVPVPLLSSAVSIARWSPRFRGLSPDMITRMQRDLCFDSEDARRDFGYAPGPFRLDAETLGLVPGRIAHPELHHE